LHSMLTEPIGPRSPDDILAVVYQRTERTRRRRRQQLSAAVAVVALGVAGVASLQAGDDEASRVRAVDRGNTKTEEVMTPTTVVAALAAPAGTAKAAPKRSRGSSPATAADRTGSPAQSAPTTVPPLPTTTTLPIDQGPQSRMLAQASDVADDALLPGWWYDIVSGSMRVDSGSGLVVFTTQYGAPDDSGNRDARTLHTEFVYEHNTVNLDVTETDNVLGVVKLGTDDCNACTRSLDEAGGRLTVGVPIDVMNDYLARLYGSGHAIEEAVISALGMKTISADLTVTADESGDAE